MAKFWLVLFCVLLSIWCCKAGVLPTATTCQEWKTSTPQWSLVTQAPSLRVRAINSDCGFWSTWIGESWQTSTIQCAKGIPCVFEQVYQSLARGYCSSPGAQVITSAYDYGQWPVNGCTGGQLCCNSTLPAYGVFVYGGGISSFTTCALTRFWLPATGTIMAVSSSASSSPATTPTSGSTSSKLSTAQIAAIVVGITGGVASTVGSILAILKYRRNRKERQIAALTSHTSALQLLPSGRRGNTTVNYHFHGNINVSVENDLNFSGGGAGRGNNRIGGRDTGGRPLLGYRSSSSRISEV